MMSRNYVRSLLAGSLVAGLALIVWLAGPPSSTAMTQGGDPFCPPGQPARFVLGIAALHDRLGAIMGEPVECEHVDPTSGDMVQHTTTGLAYYRPEINTAIFTNGEAHWALS